MSNKREPLLSDDKAISLICSVDESSWRVIRDHYEADRAKWMEIVQTLVDAMRKSTEIGATDHLDCSDDCGVFWYNALQLAAERGITPKP